MKLQQGLSILVLLPMLLLTTGCPEIPLPQVLPDEDAQIGDPEPGPAEGNQNTGDNQELPGEDEQIGAHPEIAQENLQRMNGERSRHGQSALVFNEQLAQVAEWVAYQYLTEGGGVATEEIQQKLDPYPQLAATTFTLNQVSALGSNNTRFVQWFADKTIDDITDSQSVRANLLNPQMRQVGVACVGKTVVKDGSKQYRMVFVWLFMPQPPPAEIVIYEQIAPENIDLLNEERNNRGLTTLQSHQVLNRLAQLKAQDIIQNLPFDELAHDSEALGTPHEMIISAISPTPSSTAENLWTQYGSFHSGFMTDTALQAHRGLMDSPGHRRNMLEPEFTHMGVGVAGGIVDGEEGKLYKVVLVQLFIKE